jgi:thiosulfate/3-mercaptopyruvate sulfurtransferase
MTSTTVLSEPLVETEGLANHLNEPALRVIEIDVNRTAYDGGHIPGALLWNVYADLLQPNYRVIEREPFAALLARSGIAAHTTVVVYGYGASLGLWMLRLYGHSHVGFVNGSRRKWVDEGRPLTVDAPILPASSYAVTDFGAPEQHIRASHVRVAQAIGAPGVRLMDVRSVPEYIGERFWPSLPPEGDQRGGHIPGAVLMPIEDTWREDGTFRSIAELSELYNSHGFTPDNEIITYCAVGGRASQAWFVLTCLLGYPRVRVYDGSWVEWGLLPGVPVAT